MAVQAPKPKTLVSVPGAAVQDKSIMFPSLDLKRLTSANATLEGI